MGKQTQKISDQLYQLAFEYKRTKLWTFLLDIELFAVLLSDGRIGYISILGGYRELHGLNLFIGEEGLASFRTIVEMNKRMMRPWEYQEHLFQQQSYQCVFVSKEELKKEECEEVKAYARAHQIKISGKNAYPQFLKYRPNYFPWNIQDSKEQEILCEALSAAIALTKLLKGKKPQDIGIKRFQIETESIPMLEPKGNTYVLKQVKLPKAKSVEFPEPIAGNDILIANLKRAPRSGVWECGLVRYPKPVQLDTEEVPVFPIMILAVESATDYLLPVSPAEHYEENPEKLLNLFMEALLQENIRPIEIKAQDERTYAFVKSMCDRLKIKLSIDEDLPMLENAQSEFWLRFGEDDVPNLEDSLDMLDSFLDMAEEQVDCLPKELLEQLSIMVEEGDLPDALNNKVTKIFQLADRQQPKQKKADAKITDITNIHSNESFVIKVSLGTGCYRHIQISTDSTLLELHDAIQSAFEFDDDHAHAFFMDNKIWSKQDCYYMEGIEDSYRTTKKYRLNHAGLCTGKQFKYLFDFGEEWVFQCKVLKTIEGRTDKPVVIKSKGEVPLQYGDWDDDWDDE